MIDVKASVAATTKKKSDELDLDRKQGALTSVWETPKLEDVSEQVMAQPYIRFT